MWFVDVPTAATKRFGFTRADLIQCIRDHPMYACGHSVEGRERTERGGGGGLKGNGEWEGGASLITGGLSELQERGLVQGKRLNPRRRRKMFARQSGKVS